MPEIRQDPTTREWVIIATERAKRPHEFASLPHRSGQASRSSFVFCPGNEKLVREGARWYQGTADAPRQNLRNFLERHYEYYLVLSDDHLYRIDDGDLLQKHVGTDAGRIHHLASARHCRIEGAIIDKNARIGEGVVITPNGKPATMDAEELLHPRRRRCGDQRRRDPERNFDLRFRIREHERIYPGTDRCDRKHGAVY